MGSKLRAFYFVLLGLSLFNVGLVLARRKYSRQDLLKLRQEVKEMFDHAYTGYLKYAYPYDELRPLTCDGIDTWGSYSLTLIDALDTLAVMGNFSEFKRVVNIVTANANFDANINVSVFETNIRIVGGLLSAHLMSQRAGLELEPGWPCNGPLLRLAEDVAKRLLPAFATKTGMPYGTVNLRHGVPAGETTVTCTAGVGTFILEFATLSRLTGDPVYEEVAMHALKVMYDHRSPIGLFGNHIDVKTGNWVARDSGIGAGVDSFFEYLVKGSILLNKPELMAMFNEVRKPIDKYLKKNNWYIWACMHKGKVTIPVFQSLEAYWPGVLTLIGDVETALRSMHNYNSVWKQYGFTPEFYNIAQGQANPSRESYPLRPELVESAMYLYRATGDPFMLDIGKNILRSIQHSAKTPCGYATIRDARDHTQENRMESFFLAETTKYLYLLFDPDNFIHNRGSQGRVHTLSTGKQCVLDSGAYIFNTEAHPIDASALSCCDDWKQESYNPYSSFNFRGDIVGEALRTTKSQQEETPEGIEEIVLDSDDGLDEAEADVQYALTDDHPLPQENGGVEETLTGNGEGETAKAANEGESGKVIRGVATPIGPSLDSEANVGPDEDVSATVKSKLALRSKQLDELNELIKLVEKKRKKKREELTKSDNEFTSGTNTNSTMQDETSDELTKFVDDNRKKLLAFIEELMKIEKESMGEPKVDTNQTQKETDEPTFSTNEEPKIENTSFDHVVADHDERIVTKNRVGERFDNEKTDLMTLTDYVKYVVSSPPPKKQFDPQALLESVRFAAAKRPFNSTWTTRYEYLTCKAQPFLIRITIAGEFMDEK